MTTQQGDTNQPLDPRTVFLAASELFATRGYRQTSMSDIANHLDVPVSALRTIARDKASLVDALISAVDTEVLNEDAGFTDEDSVRDRLFDLLMRRFDGLLPYRDGLQAITKALPTDPCRLLNFTIEQAQTMGWYLDAAGAQDQSVLDILRRKGLSLVWIRGLRTWFEDESPDLSQTMAVVDKDLARAEQAAGWLGKPNGRGGHENEASSPETSS